MAQKPEVKEVPIVHLDDEVRTPTSREQQLAELAEKNKSVTPQCFDISNKNAQARRVVHDFSGRPVTILPGQMQKGVLLHPKVAQYLKRQGSDLELISA